MDVGFVVYDGMTALDFVGAHDPIARLSSAGIREDVTCTVRARTERVTSHRGLTFEADRAGGPLDHDLVVVPGGLSTRELANDPAFVEWIATADDADRLVSVCTGALLLGAAGFLDGRRATTHPTAYDALSEYAADVVTDERVVEDGRVITARGVSAALDCGLFVVERLAGAEAREEVAAGMDYPSSPADR